MPPTRDGQPWLVRALSCATWVFPPEYRRRYADAVRECVAHAAREPRHRGRAGRVRLAVWVFPRNDNIAVMPEINRINENIARFADGARIRYTNINDKLADTNGVLFDGMTVDKLHPSVRGYQLWADALKPILTELLGPPASTDRAPPPTGDPSARKP